MDMQDSPRSQRLLAAVVALLLHALAMVGLALLVLRVERPASKPVELMVAVNLGNVEAAAGTEEPGGTLSPAPQPTQPEVDAASTLAPQPQPTKPSPPISQPPTPQPKSQPKPQPSEAVKTQQHEASLAAQEEARRAKAEAARQAAEAEARRRAEAEAAAREAARQQAGRSVAGAFGNKAGKSGSQGSAFSGSGNQGNPNGSAGSYALTGRSIVNNGGVLVRPATQRAVDGTVRVRIVVDGSGQVIRASVAQGTNIADTSIRAAALAAARATRFNAVAGAEEQEGIITYRFKIQD